VQNRFFSEEVLQVLLHPERWKIVSSAFSPEATPVDHFRHQHWMRAHTHDHQHQELMLMLRGQGVYGFMGQPYPCLPGTLFIFGVNEPHDLGCPPWPARMDLLWMAVLPGELVARVTSFTDGVVEDWRFGSLRLSPDEIPGQHALAFSTGDPPALARMRLVSAVSLLVSAIVQRGFGAEMSEDAEPQQQRMVHTVQRYLRETAGRGVTLDTLARISGYSKFHFLRLFHQHTGETVHQYIDRCRRQRVEAMLDQGCAKKEIAAALGFSCPSAFSRWLKKMDGWMGG